jgi:hypothetical protein
MDLMSMSMEALLVGMIFVGLAIMGGGIMWQNFQARRNMFRS